MGKYSKEISRYDNEMENVRYFGPYKFFNDAAKIYSSIDVLYMPYSIQNQSMNNKLALPNKLYEAMYYKVPIITSKNTYLGSRVTNLNIGLQSDYQDIKDLQSSLEKLFNNHSEYMKSLNMLNNDLYIADNDYLNLELFLTKDLKML